jgi:hypothetical protein
MLESEISFLIRRDRLQRNATAVLYKYLDGDTFQTAFFAVTNTIFVFVAINIARDRTLFCRRTWLLKAVNDSNVRINRLNNFERFIV